MLLYKNYRIRRAIKEYLKVSGPQDTRQLIFLMATAYNTSKQRISGNISCMKKREEIVIFSNRPHSIMYL